MNRGPNFSRCPARATLFLWKSGGIFPPLGHGTRQVNGSGSFYGPGHVYIINGRSFTQGDTFEGHCSRQLACNNLSACLSRCRGGFFSLEACVRWLLGLQVDQTGPGGPKPRSFRDYSALGCGIAKIDFHVAALPKIEIKDKR